MADESSKNMRVLEALEAGEIDVEHAVRALEDRPPPKAEPATWETPVAWYGWLGGAVGITALGGYLGSLGGGWWWLAAPLLLLGGALLLVVALSYQQPWLRVQITPANEAWDHRITFAFPFAPGAAGRILQMVEMVVPSMKGRRLSEVLLALEQEAAPGHPFVVDAVNEAKGQKVQIIWG